MRRRVLIAFLVGLTLVCAVLSYSPYYVSLIVGDSMNPNIESHDIILFEQGDNVQKGDVVDASIPNDGSMYDVIHKVERSNDSHIVTKGTNTTEYDPPTPRDRIKGEKLYVYSPPDYVKDLYRPLVPENYTELEKTHRTHTVCVIDSPTGGNLGGNILHPVCNVQDNGNTSEKYDSSTYEENASSVNRSWLPHKTQNDEHNDNATETANRSWPPHK